LARYDKCVQSLGRDTGALSTALVLSGTRRARRIRDHGEPVRSGLSGVDRLAQNRCKKDSRRRGIGSVQYLYGRVKFPDLPESDLMRSIRRFGEKVMSALRAYEPF